MDTYFDLCTDFIVDNYFVIMVILLVMFFSIIGYVADKKGFMKNKSKKKQLQSNTDSVDKINTTKELKRLNEINKQDMVTNKPKTIDEIDLSSTEEIGKLLEEEQNITNEDDFFVDGIPKENEDYENKSVEELSSELAETDMFLKELETFDFSHSENTSSANETMFETTKDKEDIDLSIDAVSGDAAEESETPLEEKIEEEPNLTEDIDLSIDAVSGDAAEESETPLEEKIEEESKLTEDIDLSIEQSSENTKEELDEMPEILQDPFQIEESDNQKKEMEELLKELQNFKLPNMENLDNINKEIDKNLDDDVWNF